MPIYEDRNINNLPAADLSGMGGGGFVGADASGNAKKVNGNDLTPAQHLKVVSNPEYAYAVVDGDGVFLFGVKSDGSFEWQKGIPGTVSTQLATLSAAIAAEVTRAQGAEGTNATAIAGKVDKVDGKGLVNETFANGVSVVSNDEFMFSLVDSHGIFLFGVRKDGSFANQGKINVSTEDVEKAIYDGGFILQSKKPSFTKSINHRGYNTIAPENTLEAFRLSYKMGFDCVETDIWNTKDKEIVCIHDDTVNRTSDGTGYVYGKTLSELKTLDFGSWKSAEYAGAKIPTFKEFLACCRNLGLKAYVELKGFLGDDYVNIPKAINEAIEYGMAYNITWLSSNVSHLQIVKNNLPKARLGIVCFEISQDVVSSAINLKSSENEVFVDCDYSAINSTALSLVAENKIPLEVFVVDNILTAENLGDYVSGFTSNYMIVSNELNKIETNR